MKINLVGGSYQQASLPFDAQRSVNLYAIADESGKDVASLNGTAGCLEFMTIGVGPCRKGFSAANGRAFAVSGSGVYEIFAGATSILRGSVGQSQGNMTIAENGLQMAVCDGQGLYILTYATNVFQKVANLNALSVDFVDGYFVINEPNSGRFRVSNVYDGLTWDALSFATAESSPDLLLRVLNVSGQLWLFGLRTIEIWSSNGSAFFPFSRVGGSTMNVGIVGTYAVQAIDNSAIWVGQDENGFGILYRADGFNPQRISTEPIELRIQSAPSPTTFFCYAYQEQGHSFFILSGGGMETALCYDLTTQLVHERASLNELGNYSLPLPIDCIFAFNKHLTFDKSTNQIYEQSLNYYSENGRELVRDRIFTHLIDDNKRIKFTSLTVGFESGVGSQTGQGSDPKAALSLSNDGGRTFSAGRLVSIGRVGSYFARAIWNRLGMARIRTFRVRITEPVKVAITGAYLN